MRVARHPLFAAALSTAIVSGAALAQSPPDFTPSEPSFQYYEVTGATLEDLVESLDQNGPTADRGLRTHGLTEWRIEWTYVPWKRRTDCKLTHIETILHATVTLPRWKSDGSATEQLMQRWNAFLEALTEHELGHVKYAQDAQQAIQAALSSVGPKPTCGTAQRDADRIALDLLWEYRALDRKYDRDTRHGRDLIDPALEGG